MSRELSCPICDADVPMDGDEAPGSEVFCAYCRAPLNVRFKRGGSDEELELDDDL